MRIVELCSTFHTLHLNKQDAHHMYITLDSFVAKRCHITTQHDNNHDLMLEVAFEFSTK